MKKLIALIFTITTLSGLAHGSIKAELSETYSNIRKWLLPKPSTPLQQGHQYFKQGNYSKAKRSYQRHLESDHLDRDAWHHLALSHLATGSPGDASFAVNSAIAILPHSKYQITLARVQIYLGEILSARKNLTSIVAADPKLPTAWLLLGRCHESMGTMELAETCYHKALALDPNCHDADTRLLILGKKKEGDAFPQHRDALASNPTPRVPKSRLLKETHTLPTDNPAGLCSLVDSYHVSEDAPEPGLVPSEIIIWDPSNAIQQESQTGSSRVSPSYEKFTPHLPNTRLKLDDL